MTEQVEAPVEETPQETPEETQDFFANFDNDEDIANEPLEPEPVEQEPIVEVEPKAEPAPVEEPAPEGEPAPQAEPVAETPPAEPQPQDQPQPPPQEAPEQQPPQGVQQPPTPEQIQEYRTEQAKQVAKSLYNLGEEEAAEIITNPSEALPLLAAKIHMSVMDNMGALIQQQLPEMIRGISVQQSGATSARQAFYEKWPKLAGHEQQVNANLLAYRQVNPQASLEDVINNVGTFTSIQLQLPVENAPAAAPPSQQVAPSPAPPPAGNVGVGNAPSKRTPVNPFEQMAQEMLEDSEW